MSLFSRDLANLHRQMNSMFDIMHQSYGPDADLDLDLDSFGTPIYGLPLLTASSVNVQPKDESALVANNPNDSVGQSNRLGRFNNRFLSMNVDMHALPDSYNLTCDLPGVEKASIDVSADKKNHVLSIKAEKRSQFSLTSGTEDNKQATDQSKNDQSKSDNSPQKKTSTNASNQSSGAVTTQSQNSQPRMIHQERSYGMVQRSIRLANDADLDHIQAKYENGVLQLNVPRIKRVEQPSKKIEIL